MVTADQIKSMGERLERLASYLNLEQKRIHIINEEENILPLFSKMLSKLLFSIDLTNWSYHL